MLFNTYAKLSCGCIMQIKEILDNLSKSTKTITEYMQLIKFYNDELSLMNTPYDVDDLTLKILNGLGDDYLGLSNAVKARKTLVSFDELHEKLIIYKAQLLQDAAGDKKTQLPTIGQCHNKASTKHSPFHIQLTTFPP